MTRREQDAGASRGHRSPPGLPTGSHSYDDGGASDAVIDIVAVVAAIVILTLTALAC